MLMGDFPATHIINNGEGMFPAACDRSAEWFKGPAALPN